jgi:hypothetical protein
MHRPPHLRRRTLLKLGIGSAIVLAVAGGTVAMMKPGLIDGKLSPSARLVMTRVAQAMLLGTLPADPGSQKLALDALLQRTDAFLVGLPTHVLAELDQLLGLLASAPGRRWLVGLSASWQDATPAETYAALKSMLGSGTDLRIQACQGLHDLVMAPYFSGEESWAVLGYPGPVAV